MKWLYDSKTISKIVRFTFYKNRNFNDMWENWVFFVICLYWIIGILGLTQLYLVISEDNSKSGIFSEKIIKIKKYNQFKLKTANISLNILTNIFFHYFKW